MKKKMVMAVAGLALAAALVLFACELGVNDPIRTIPIIEPYISVQPKSFSYTVAEYSSPPELGVEVWEWRKEDGTISYQWYAFDAIADYCGQRSGTKIEGATGDTYTPAGITAAAGKNYYFYVVVTNDYPDATDRKTASVQSEVAIISFAAANNVPVPVITRHPVNAAYQVGRTAGITPLEVRAEVPSGGILGYQWYSNDKYSIEGGALIPGADNSAYIPSALNVGENYFYVVITNTVAADTASQFCLPVIVNMLPGEKAEAPRIDQQPRNMLIFTGGTVGKLSVSAESIDGGAIEYQWYSATSEQATVTKDKPVVTGTIITENANGNEYTPVINTAAAGNYYYYVVVTNRNDVVTGAKTASVQSKPVTVRVAAPGQEQFNATIFIEDPNGSHLISGQPHPNKFQYIRGYGGMDVAWNNFPVQRTADTELMHNPDWGMGYNMLRIMIMPPGSNDGAYVGHEPIVQKIEEFRLNYGGHSYVENVKIVNKYNGYVLASPWTPPKEWKTNNSINSGGHLIPAYYKTFANYLKAFAQYMYYRGAPIYAISIANEPNYAGGYDGCEWTPEQMRDFYKEVGHFTDGVRGYGGGKQISTVLTMNGESANNPNINFAALNDPVSRSAIDVFARHVYGSQTTTLWENQYADYKEGSPYETECWMTEHNINSATPTAFPNDHTWNYIWRFMNDVDLVIRMNNENAFVWWANKRFYSYIGDGQAGTSDGSPLPRGWGLSHYAKFTIDTRRIYFTMTGNLADGTTPIGNLGRPNSPVNPSSFSLDSTSAKITAFISQDGNEISLVMFTPTLTNGSSGVDLGRIKIDLVRAGFKIGSATAVRSTSRESLFIPEDVEVSEGRDSAYVTLGRSQILSVKFTRQ